MTRLGRWIDFENDYKTMDPSFMESVWWVFSQLWAKGLVYKGFKVRSTCANCAALANGRPRPPQQDASAVVASCWRGSHLKTLTAVASA